MINEKVMYRQEKFFSPTLNKDIEVDVYDGDNDAIVISSKSLANVFEEHVCEAQMRTQLVRMFTNDKGDVTYCLVRVTLMANGQEIEKYGEICTATAKTEIAINNPFATAQKRAESKCIIEFLRLPGRVYSSDEIGYASTKQNLQDVLTKVGKKAEAKNDENGFVAASVASNIETAVTVGKAEKVEDQPKIDEPTEDITPEIPDVPLQDMVNQAWKEAQSQGNMQDQEAEPKNNPKLNTEPFPAAKTDVNVEEIVPDDDVAEEKESKEPKKDAQTTVAQPQPAQEAKPIEQPEEEKEPVAKKDVANNAVDNAGADNADDAGMNLIVTFGPAKLKNLTVREVLADSTYAKFVENIQNGRAVAPVDNPEKLAIFNAIRNAKSA